jgi:transcriptional regulator with XRE-family HTH domain
MAHGAPPIEQRRLRAELRRFREESGRTQKVVADALGWSTSKVIRLETGATNITVADLRALLQYYDTDAERAKDLLAIASGKQEAWWDQHRQTYSQTFLNFLGYEDSARHVRQFMIDAIPGLFQIEAYTRALFTAYLVKPEAAESGVRIRQRRQELLTRENGPRFQFILDESVIHRRVGGPAVMAAQLSRLKELAELPRVSIRILPFAAGAHHAMNGSFTILEFSEHEDHVVILEDASRKVQILDDPESSSIHLEIFSSLEDIADSEEDLSKIVDPVLDRMLASEAGPD